MARISVKDEYFTTINVFSTTPEHQKRLAEIVVEGAEAMKSQPGFVSASIHLSYDGTRVVGYAQWASEDDFHGMRARADLQGHFEEVHELGSIESIACRVAYTSDED
ncbi:MULTISPECIES: antibiotic biosynthesis monooxygenase family protein [unclassified Streptomyces]|uniref:Antibiotic biosynthesis monooxygenase family protein n=1 Tax=Streptomyces sp. R08 TaxID=3238624 RepID=A0AB39MB71_9ACTN|nr:antibiotic biosynthesis monooxygenase family protein [Streptomyces sp. NBC_00696]